MRKMRSAIAMLVVAFGLNIITASTACADEGKISLDDVRRGNSDAITIADENLPLDPPADPGEFSAPIRYYDNRGVDATKLSGDRVGMIFFEGLLGGGITETIAEGREYGAGSQFQYARASLRFASVEWHNHAVFQFGAYLRQEAALFKSSQFKGDILGFGGGGEIAILDVSDAKQAWWSFTGQFGLGLQNQTGESRVSSFVLEDQRTITLDWNLRYEGYQLFIGSGHKYRAYDDTREWETGFFHAWSLSFYGTQKLTASRHESALVNGVSVRQRGDISDISRYGLQGQLYVYRGACPTGEWAFGAMVGVEFSRAAGSKSADNGDTLTGFMFGVHGRLQLYKDLYLYLNSSLTHTSPVDRWDLSVGASIQIVKF